jgi:prepilin peptidase CpaA
MTNGAFTEILLIILAILLVVAAVIDVRTFTISNRLNLAVALMAPLYWWAANLPLWPDIGQQIIAAVLVFALLAVAFYAGMMGGGDVKLAAALALWFSVKSTVTFLIFMSITGGLLTLVVVALHRIRKKDGKPQIPYGVAIALGGLIILIQRFLNQFA